MKNNNLVNAFKAFEIKNLQKIGGGLRYSQTGGGINSGGSSYADFSGDNGTHKCGVPDGTLPQDYNGPDMGRLATGGSSTGSASGSASGSGGSNN